MSGIDYNYLTISAYKPNKLRGLSKKRRRSVIGLYDGDQFQQPVICPECGGGVNVNFNSYGQPENGQCMKCALISKLYYRIDSTYLLRNWEVARIYKR